VPGGDVERQTAEDGDDREPAQPETEL